LSLLGYFAFGEENLSTIYPEHNTNFEDKDLGDYKEGIDFGPEVDPSEADEFRKLNCWPDEKLLGKEWKQQVHNIGSHNLKAHELLPLFRSWSTLPWHLSLVVY